MIEEKTFKFGSGDLVRLRVIDGELHIHLQARHMEEKLRITSAGVLMDAGKSREFAEWLANHFLQEDYSA